MYQNETYDETDLREIFKILHKHIKLLIIAPIIFAIIGATISIYLIKPVYEASTTIIVRQEKQSNEEMNISDVNLSKSLIYTYAEMAMSMTVLDMTRKELGLESLNPNSIAVSPVKDTQILRVSVQNTDKQLSMDIANTLVEQFTTEVLRITKTDNVAVVDYAVLPSNPIKPSKVLNALIAGIIGEVLAILMIFISEYLDSSIKTEKDIEKYLEIPVIGIIPNSNTGGKLNGKLKNEQSKLSYDRSL